MSFVNAPQEPIKLRWSLTNVMRRFGSDKNHIWCQIKNNNIVFNSNILYHENITKAITGRYNIFKRGWAGFGSQYLVYNHKNRLDSHIRRNRHRERVQILEIMHTIEGNFVKYTVFIRGVIGSVHK